MVRSSPTAVFLGLVLFTWNPAFHTGSRCIAQDRSYYFYRDLPYGSDAVFHPFGVLLNGGLDVLQSYTSTTHLDDIPWRNGSTSVWRSITAPAYWVNRYGWSRFFGQEVVPTSLSVKKAQWAPNYTLHAIGGGMEYRKLSEWYLAHGIPLPFVAGAVTAMGYHYLNELVENSDNIHPNTDAIADLLIFDPLGIILFSFDDVAEYFSRVWNLNDWSPQASISLNPVAFRNFGHSFAAKYFPGEQRSTAVFLFLGKSTLLGASLRMREQEWLSLGAGATQTGVWEVDASNGIPTNSIRVGATGGVFYDRDNSLLASLLVSEYYLERIRLNVYPGALSASPFVPGLFFTLGERGTFAAGMTIRFVPVGIGFFAPR